MPKCRNCGYPLSLGRAQAGLCSKMCEEAAAIPKLPVDAEVLVADRIEFVSGARVA